jgi:hypothetical protein
MSTFEPATVIAILKNSTAVTAQHKKEFAEKWKKSVSYFTISSDVGLPSGE